MLFCLLFEVEYITITEGSNETLRIKNFLQEIGVKQDSYIMYCDNQSAIYLAKNSTYHYKSKYIDVRYHWIQDMLAKKLWQFEKIHSTENGSNMMTKSVPKEKLKS